MYQTLTDRILRFMFGMYSACSCQVKVEDPQKRQAGGQVEICGLPATWKSSCPKTQLHRALYMMLWRSTRQLDYVRLRFCMNLAHWVIAFRQAYILSSAIILGQIGFAWQEQYKLIIPKLVDLWKSCAFLPLPRTQIGEGPRRQIWRRPAWWHIRMICWVANVYFGIP